MLGVVVTAAGEAEAESETTGAQNQDSFSYKDNTFICHTAKDTSHTGHTGQFEIIAKRSDRG